MLSHFGNPVCSLVVTAWSLFLVVFAFDWVSRGR